MMSWDSDVVSFRCGNTSAYYYRISTQSITQFNIEDLEYTAPMPFPSGLRFFHNGNVYDEFGIFERSLNLDAQEHSCLGRMSDGSDAYYNISFEEGPYGDCQGTLVAHHIESGNCFSVTPPDDYGYPKSGTHISALSHKNSEGGWVAVSSMGFDLDGQSLLDQEIFIAKVSPSGSDVYRVAHHRSDEDDFDYFGEPHVTISPTGTRLLFGSDWSGDDDGHSVDCYVAELNAHEVVSSIESLDNNFILYPNPVSAYIILDSTFDSFAVYDLLGKLVVSSNSIPSNQIDVSQLNNGVYIVQLSNHEGIIVKKFRKQSKD